jgi:hypothetical protein
MTVNFKEEPLISDLKLDLGGIVKTEDTHLPGWIYYTNAADGVMVAGGLHTASSITYFPGEKDKGLRCPVSRAEQALPAGLAGSGLYRSYAGESLKRVGWTRQ